MKNFRHIWVGYGKNQRYVTAEWVHEDAIEMFKAAIIAEYRERGWQKEFCFIENMEPCKADDNSSSYIFGMGANGEYGEYGVA